jgi:hypothetical protein
MTEAPAFARFWECYPRHEAKRDALKAWVKLNPSPALQALIHLSIAEQAQGRKWREGFICLPATFLRGERWNDAVEPLALPFNARATPAYGCDWCDHHPRCDSPDLHALKARVEQRRGSA